MADPDSRAIATTPAGGEATAPASSRSLGDVPRFELIRFGLVRWYLVISLVVMAASATTIGAWLSRQIERSVIDRTAAFSSLYVNSVAGHYLQELDERRDLDPSTRESLRRLIGESSLAEQIVSFKVWTPDSRIVFTTSPEGLVDLDGVNPDVIQTLGGEVVSVISDLSEQENDYERSHFEELIETYAPVYSTDTGDVIAVTEFYELPDDLLAEVARARHRAWLVVIAVSSTAYLVLAGFVIRAGTLILEQSAALHQVSDQNRSLRRRVQRAAARSAALGERHLRRVSSDLHDGPAQSLSLALLRLDRDTPATLRPALESTLESIRSVASGLRTPDLEELDMGDVVARAVNDVVRSSGAGGEIDVRIDVTGSAGHASLPTKLTAYRVIQEAMSNAIRHASMSRLSVVLRGDTGSVEIDISDDGTGFDTGLAPSPGHLGLSTMRERTEMLGGRLGVTSTPGVGTTVSLRLPRTPTEAGEPDGPRHVT
ncbi:MAG: sensor histidine kinase [Acidimicrobiales bacterium]